MELDESLLNYDEFEENHADFLIQYPILQRLDIIPAVLLTSEFDKNAPGVEIANVPWLAVFLTSPDNEEFCSIFQTDIRNPVNQCTNDKISLSREALPVVRCVPRTDCPPNLKLADIGRCLRDVLGKILDRNGVIFVNNITEDYYSILSQVILDRNRKKSLFILGICENSTAKYLVEKEYAQILPENRNELWSQYSSWQGSENNEHCEHLQIAGKMLSIPRSDTFKISHFGELLTFEKAGQEPNIERGDVPVAFRNFLERSVGGFPVWHCYNPLFGFHLHRTIEDTIFPELVKAMGDADHNGDKARPLLLCGQAYSGKTNILCSLAWQMFARNTYPVIYMPNAILPSDIAEIAETLAYLLKELELRETSNIGDVVPTLIVWDTSCRQLGELEMIRNLLRAIRREGRQVQMICTSYEYGNDEDNHKCDKDFKFFHVDALLNAEEQKALIEILRTKGGFTDEEIRYCTNWRIAEDPHFIATLYQFGELHDEIQNHVGSEIEGANCYFEEIVEKLVEKNLRRNFNDTMSIMLDNLNLSFESSKNETSTSKNYFQEHLAKVIECLALCTYYDCAMPITLALRLLNEEFPNPSDIYIAILNHSMLREQTHGRDDEPQLRIRSSLEAKVIIDATTRRFGDDCRIDLLLTLLDRIDFSNWHEVELVRRLIQSIGPNCKMINRDAYCLWNSKQRERFLDIWKLLRTMRLQKTTGGNADKLLPQELSLIREYYRKADISAEARDVLIEARDTAREKLERNENGSDPILEANIIVEYCKLIKLLIERGIDLAETIGDLYRRNHIRLYQLGVKTNDLYILSILLELGCDYYDSLDHNSDEAIKLLAELFNYCSRVEEGIDYFTNFVSLEISRVYQRIDDFNCDSANFERSIAAKDPNGIYLRVIQKKRIIDTLPSSGNQLREDCKRLAKELLQNYLLNERYKELIEHYRPLMKIRIQMLWMAYTGREIIPKSDEERLRPQLSENEWCEIERQCAAFASLDGDIKNDPLICYLAALTALTLGQYARGANLLEGIYRSKFRRGNWYLICDNGGTPRFFVGQLEKKSPDKRHGYLHQVRAVNSPSDSSFRGVRFMPEQLGWTQGDCNQVGRITPRFWISVSLSGMEVVRPDGDGR